MGNAISDAEIDRRIDERVAATRHNAEIARKRRLPGGPKTEHLPGGEQRAALRFIRDQPRSFHELRALLCIDRGRAVDIVAGLAARGLIERHAGVWRPTPPAPEVAP